MTNKEQIDFLNDTVKVKLGQSKVHGVGVIALRDIKKGDRLYCFPSVQMQWLTLTYANFSKLWPEVKELILERWPSVLRGAHFISPNDMSWLICWMNHSTEPNYDPKTDCATKTILKGEEVFEDYTTIPNYEIIYPFLKTNAQATQ